jgi:prevent-host-death family protein
VETKKALARCRHCPLKETDVDSKSTLNFETLSMMELRSSPGEVLDRVSEKGMAYVIVRNGQPKACLVPVSIFLPNISQDRIKKEIDALKAIQKAPWQLTISKDKEFVARFKEKVGQNEYTVEIILPHGYPNVAPKVRVLEVSNESPHKWSDGFLCIFGVMTTWNPGKHKMTSVLELAITWLSKYEEWLESGSWPKEEDNDT